MFDDITRQEGGRRAARRSAFLLGSSAFQALLVLALIALSARMAARLAEGPVVDVKFIKQGEPPRPPPPPPPARKRTTPRPRSETARKLNPIAMIQPKEVPAELKPPNPNEPIEEELGEGVEGGVIGGVVGGQVGSSTIEEAPAYATSGFRKPRTRTPKCIESAIRIPPDLAGLASSVTVKFAVGRDGQVSLFQLMTPADKRIETAIWQAIQSCPFIPGADPQGRPTKIWVVVPVRFAFE